MTQTDPGAQRPLFVRLGAIACVVGVLAFAFVYAGGWLDADRITPVAVIERLTPPGVNAQGHRRNHAKGVCFTGLFESNGAAAALSRAPMLAAGQYPAMGRFNLGVGDPNAADMTARVRGLGLQITAGDQVWRSAMIDAPVFPVSTPPAFYALLGALGSKDPGAMPAFVAAHPEFAAFGQWATKTPFTSSYTQDRFNSLDAFLFVDAAGATHPVRWSFVPAATPVPATPEELGKRGPNALEQTSPSGCRPGRSAGRCW
jgi:catalase